MINWLAGWFINSFFFRLFIVARDMAMSIPFKMNADSDPILSILKKKLY